MFASVCVCVCMELNCLLNQRTVLRIYLLIGFPKLKIHVLQTQTLTTISKYIQLHRWDMWRILFDCHRNASLAFHKPSLSLFFFIPLSSWAGPSLYLQQFTFLSPSRFAGPLSLRHASNSKQTKQGDRKEGRRGGGKGRRLGKGRKKKLMNLTN